jgi:hypothetical protein
VALFPDSSQTLPQFFLQPSFRALGLALDLDLEQKNVETTADAVQLNQDIDPLGIKLWLFASWGQPPSDQRNYNCNGYENEREQYARHQTFS